MPGSSSRYELGEPRSSIPTTIPGAATGWRATRQTRSTDGSAARPAATLGAMDFESTPPPPQANPTGRALPTHGRHQGSTGPVRSAFATVEGPIEAGSMVTQRFERNAEGRFERQIAGSLLLATDAI